MKVKKNFLSEYLSDDDLKIISNKISEIEKKTSGELRVLIKKRRGIFEKKFSPREIALKSFTKLKMHKTKDKTGVMIFILFDEKKFEIIADEGINSKIISGFWNDITESMKTSFINKNYLGGISSSIEKLGEALIKEFPVKPDDKDELSNEVIVTK